MMIPMMKKNLIMKKIMVNLTNNLLKGKKNFNNNKSLILSLPVCLNDINIMDLIFYD